MSSVVNIELSKVIERILEYARLIGVKSIAKCKYDEMAVDEVIKSVVEKSLKYRDDYLPENLVEFSSVNWKLLSKKSQKDYQQRLVDLLKCEFLEMESQNKSLMYICNYFGNYFVIYDEVFRSICNREFIAFYQAKFDEYLAGESYDKVIAIINNCGGILAGISTAKTVEERRSWLTLAKKSARKKERELVKTAKDAYEMAQAGHFPTDWYALVRKELNSANTPEEIWQLFVYSPPWTKVEWLCLKKLYEVLSK